MPRRKPVEPSDPNAVDANQVVAYNFRRARELREWTQDFTAGKLAPYLGTELKKTSISAIERSVESDRRRVFTAQEIVAFALAFNVPVVWFFIPPPVAGLRLAGAHMDAFDLWPLTMGTDQQMAEVRDRLVELAAEFPNEARVAVDATLEYEPNVTWEHFRQQRVDGLLDLVAEERDHLDDLFLQMKDLVDRYETKTMRYSIMGDTPRKAYRRTAEVLLGKKVWELINDEYGRKVPGLALDSLIDHENVPWEELINTDRPEVKEAVLKFAEAIEPEMRDYLSAIIDGSMGRNRSEED